MKEKIRFELLLIVTIVGVALTLSTIVGTIGEYTSITVELLYGGSVVILISIHAVLRRYVEEHGATTTLYKLSEGLFVGTGILLIYSFGVDTESLIEFIGYFLLLHLFAIMYSESHHIKSNLDNES